MDPIHSHAVRNLVVGFGLFTGLMASIIIGCCVGCAIAVAITLAVLAVPVVAVAVIHREEHSVGLNGSLATGM